MKVTNYITVFFIFLCFVGKAQDLEKLDISGIVFDNAKNLPIPGVLVYQDNTSNFTETDSEGKFQLLLDTLIGSEIQFNHINYIDKSLSFSRSVQDKRIYLKQRENVLQELEVKAKRGKRRKTRMNVFKRELIGMSQREENITFENEDAVLMYEDDGILKAKATEDLVIRNDFTGYTIHFNLKKFEHDASKDKTFFVGKAYFKSLPDELLTEQHLNNRKFIYEKSIRHFLTSLLEEGAIDNSYEVHKARKKALNEFELLEKLEEKDVLFVEGSGLSNILIIEGAIGFKNKELFSSEANQLHTVITNQNLGDLLTPYDAEIEAPMSYLYSSTGKVFFNDYGIIQNINQVTEYGYIIAQRVGHMLPLDYVP